MTTTENATGFEALDTDTLRLVRDELAKITEKALHGRPRPSPSQIPLHHQHEWRRDLDGDLDALDRANAELATR